MDGLADGLGYVGGMGWMKDGGGMWDTNLLYLKWCAACCVLWYLVHKESLECLVVLGGSRVAAVHRACTTWFGRDSTPNTMRYFWKLLPDVNFPGHIYIRDAGNTHMPLLWILRRRQGCLRSLKSCMIWHHHPLKPSNLRSSPAVGLPGDLARGYWKFARRWGCGFPILP